jgi:hypothetical protein
MKMKIIGYETLVMLNQSSIHAGRKQNLRVEQIAAEPQRQYTVNFHFDHVWRGGHDIRLSVILKPGVLTAWLDVSPEEFAAIPELEVSELDWEAAVCVGTPRWTD